MSQRALTKQLGLSAHSNIADYETGRRIPPRDIVLECERVLGAKTLSPLLEDALAARAATPAPKRRPWRWLALGAVLAVAAGITPLLMLLLRDEPSTWDGNDPKAAGCADDAVSIAAEPVSVEAVQVGTAVLRYSPSCGAAWAKFEPLPQASPPANAVVVVEAVRPADGMKTVFHYPSFEQVYGDLLLTGRGCVRATAIVTLPDGRTGSGTTKCLSP